MREASMAAEDQSQAIAELKRKIATLETELEKAREQPSSPRISLTSGGRTLSTPPSSNGTDISVNSNFSPLLSDSSHRLSPVDGFHDYSLLSSRTSPEIAPLNFPLDDAVYEATSSVAYLSLAHHGEFVGRGSLICALHSVGVFYFFACPISLIHLLVNIKKGSTLLVCQVYRSHVRVSGTLSAVFEYTFRRYNS